MRARDAASDLTGWTPGKALRRFVIIGMPRTGSNLLCSLLNAHRRVVADYEEPARRFADTEWAGFFEDPHKSGSTDP